MAKTIKEGYRQIIKEVVGGRYLQKFYEDIESGCIFTEEEYHKRTTVVRNGKNCYGDIVES